MTDHRYTTREGWKLVDCASGEQISVGDRRNLHDGALVRVTWLQPPRHAGNRGTVSAREFMGSGRGRVLRVGEIDARYVWTGGGA